MNLRRFNAIFVSRNREFIRDRAFLGWTILFPVVIVFGFAFAFSGDGQDRFKVGVVGEATDHPFFSTRFVFVFLAGIRLS